MPGEAWLVLGPVIAAVLVPLVKAVGRGMRWVLTVVGRSLGESAAEYLWASMETRLDDKLAPVYDELTANGGESVKDKVDRIDLRLGNVEGQLESWLNGGA